MKSTDGHRHNHIRAIGHRTHSHEDFFPPLGSLWSPLFIQNRRSIVMTELLHQLKSNRFQALLVVLAAAYFAGHLLVWVLR